PATHHEVHAAAGEVLQHRVVLRDLHRVVGGDQRGRGGEDDPFGLRAEVRERGGGGGGDERRVVVLADGEDVEAHLFGELALGDHVLQALVLGGHLPGHRVRGDVRDGEDAELHGALLESWGPARDRGGGPPCEVSARLNYLGWAGKIRVTPVAREPAGDPGIP